MILGRAAGAIRVKADGGGLRAVGCSCCSCKYGSGQVSASSSARVSLGITVTNALSYLVIHSSGNCDLICPEYWSDGAHWSTGGPCYPAKGMKCTRPNAPFTAPQQLQIYIGNTLLTQNTNYNGITSLRGSVSVKILDSGYYDNCGFYFVSGSVCPPL
jgi:hypothetical protein